jgi:hypothetical protein
MPDGLEDRPFAWTRRGAEVHISHRGRPATVLRSAAADRFLARLSELDEDGTQQLMARVTGNFRRGNERR